MGRNIDYGNLMHDAMRGLIRKVLQDVADNGLPGAHHFFITFDTSHPDAELADWLSDRYPGEMTVVMQHWYDKLEVTDDGFSITLNFGDAPEPLYIPFESQDTTDSDDLVVKTPEQDKHEVVPAPVAHTDHTDAKKKPGKKDADVVSLDSFRKH